MCFLMRLNAVSTILTALQTIMAQLLHQIHMALMAGGREHGKVSGNETAHGGVAQTLRHKTTSTMRLTNGSITLAKAKIRTHIITNNQENLKQKGKAFFTFCKSSRFF